jgi:hypothetical protein
MRMFFVERQSWGIAFHPAGGLLAVGLGGVSFFDLATGAQRLRVVPDRGLGMWWGAPRSFSPDGRLLLAGQHLLDLSEVQERLRAPGPAAGAVALGPSSGLRVLGYHGVLSRDGRFAAAVDYPNSPSHRLEVWEVAGWRRLWREPTPGGGLCRGLALAPDGRLLAALTARAVPLLDVGTRAVLARLEHPEQPGAPAAFSPDGRLLALATYSHRRVWLWDVESRRCAAKLPAFRYRLNALAFHPGGRLLAAGAEDGLIRLWDTASFREAAAFDWKVGAVQALAFAPDGMTAAAKYRDTVVIWDVDQA